MVTLIVISSILVYVFIGAVVGVVWTVRGENSCVQNQDRYYGCDHDHEISGLLAGIFWPVAWLAWAFAVGGYRLVMWTADKFIK